MNDGNVALESAVAAFQSGHLGEAEDFAQQVLLQDPDHPDALHLLGLIAVQAEELGAAAELLKRAYDAAEGHPAIAANLASVLGRIGRSGEQAEIARAALQKAPDSGDLWNNLGHALQDDGDVRGAVASFDKAYELMPDDVEAGLNLAAAQYALGDARASASTYAKILETAPDDSEAGVGLGMAQLADGHRDAALASFRRVFLSDPSNVEALYQLADNGVMRADEAAVAMAALSGPEIDESDRARLHFALGTYAAETDESQAMRHFDEANTLRATQLRAEGRAFDPDAFDAYVDGLIDVFTASWFAEHGGDTERTTRTVFIVGLPGAGGDIVERLIGAHPLASSGGELGVFHSLNGLAQAARAITAETLSDIGGWHEGRLTKVSATAQRVTDSTMVNFLCLGLIAAVYPAATIIHAHSSAEEVGMACYLRDFDEPHPWATNLEMIGRYIRAHERLMAHWRTVLPVPILEVDAQALVERPEGEVRRVLDALRLPFDDACVGAAATFSRARYDGLNAFRLALKNGLDGGA